MSSERMMDILRPEEFKALTRFATKGENETQPGLGGRGRGWLIAPRTMVD